MSYRKTKGAAMQMVFIYGGVASGKLTVARHLAEKTGFALFHNHLIVDAVAAVFPFGSEPFVRLRDQFWMEMIETAAAAGRSLIFTFAPEPSVSPDFPARVQAAVGRHGGRLMYVALDVSADEQERRLIDQSRSAFGKLRDLELFRQLRLDFDACLAAMPTARLVLDTGEQDPEASADAIVTCLAEP
jgi:hypothetical protein